MNKNKLSGLLAICLLCVSGLVHADTFVANDVFGLEYADDPQISPSGEHVVYVRKSMDIMNDRVRSNLWIIDSDGRNHRAIASASADFFSPRWSADGGRLLYVSTQEGSVQIYLRWMDSGQVARLTDLTSKPAALSWSPDGSALLFSSAVNGSDDLYTAAPASDGTPWPEAFEFRLTRITESAAEETDASYSPDGERIAFIRGRGQLIVRPAGGGGGGGGGGGW